jgi:hypothetical protein
VLAALTKTNVDGQHAAQAATVLAEDAAVLRKTLRTRAVARSLTPHCAGAQAFPLAGSSESKPAAEGHVIRPVLRRLAR